MEEVRPFNESYNQDEDMVPIERRNSAVSQIVAEAAEEETIDRKADWRELLHFFRPGFILNHLDGKSFIITSRTYIHFIILVFITLVPEVNVWFGSAPFLVNVAGIWDPPGGFSVLAGCFMAFMHVFVTSLSFLFFVVIHAINWRVGGYLRPVQVFASYPECTLGDDLCLATALLDGKYLSIGKTAITIFGIVAGLWTNWLIESFKPYLRFCWFFGMLTIIMTAPLAAHDPLFRPWYWGRSAILGFGIAAALKAILCIVWFPITSGEKIANWMTSTLDELNANTTEMFNTEATGDPSKPEFIEQMKKFPQLIEKILTKSSTISFDMIICKYELTYSRFEWRDLHEMATRIKSLGNVFYNYSFTYSELGDRVQATQKPTDTFDTSSGCATKRSPLKAWMNKNTTQSYQPVGKYEKNRHLEYVQTDQVLRQLPMEDLDVFFHEITEHYLPLREASSNLVQVVNAWIEDANNYRLWSLVSSSYRKECIAKQQRNAKRLENAMHHVDKVYDQISADSEWTSEKLLKKHHEKGTSSYILGYALHYGFITKEYVRHIRSLGKWLLYLDRTQSQPIWTLHKGNMKRSEKIYATEAVNAHNDMDVPSSHVRYEPVAVSKRRNPDASPPRTLMHLFFTEIFDLERKIWTPRVAYGLKVAFTAIVPLIPFFVRPSLRFMSDRRGIWITIICMISVNSSSADSMFAFMSRILATVLGCAIGCIGWYMSAGHSDVGNPYGMGAVMAVLGVFIVFFRHFNTVGGVVMNIVTTLTIVLVTLGSYQQKHNPALALALKESGAVLALERLVTVILGMIMAFISMLFPHFNTSKREVRVRLGRNLQSIGDIQSDVLNYAFQRYDDPQVHRDIYKDTVVRKIRAGHHRNRQIETQLSMLRFEPPLTGEWPKRHYKLFVQLEEQLMHLLPLIYNLITRIEDRDNIPVLLECMGWTDPDILGSLSSVIFMGSAAIERAEPLPTITPAHTTEEYQNYQIQLFNKGGWKGKGYEKELSKTHDGKLILVGMILAEVFYQRIDALFLIIKSLVGEFGSTDRRAWEGFDMV